ncbi:unnamed protein product [Closterium sp. Naga37s-1]|nr:unnamed protein product [Closterium sp. Naga37s-1]
MILLQQSLSSRLAGTTASDWQNDHPQPTYRRYPSFSFINNGENSAREDADSSSKTYGSSSASGAANDGVRTGGSSSAYNTSSGIVAGKVNVHLVPHSHDDLGWLNTVEQYYITAVQFILETVVDQLEANPDRRFIQVEQGFFYRWWQQQSEGMRRRVRALVHSGQLEFINGGWVMHDEAVCHYRDVLHHMSLGHRFLRRHFNTSPSIAWQIDPFGHSATQASLITAQVRPCACRHAFGHSATQARLITAQVRRDEGREGMALPEQGGLDAVFFARADHEDIARRKRERSTEFVWRASQTFGRQAEVFAGILYWDGYFAPEPFRFEPYDPLTNLVKDGRVNALYSTPSRYLDAKHRSNQSWPLKEADFFPYASASTEYWTGYYSSRPAFKGYARMCSSLLQGCACSAAVNETLRHPYPPHPSTPRPFLPPPFHPPTLLLPQAATLLEATVGQSKLLAWGNQTSRLVVPVLLSTNLTTIHAPSPPASRLASTFPLEEAVAVAQHHDAITGTAKQHVNDDYTLQLYKGAQEVGPGMAQDREHQECGHAGTVAQQHGAITGTAKQHVSDDYTLQLYRGVQEGSAGGRTCGEGEVGHDEYTLQPYKGAQEASVIVTSSLAHLITQGALDLQPAAVSTPAAPAARTTVQPAAPAETLYNETENLGNRGTEGALRLGLDFQLCPLLNISYCPPTHHPIPHGTTLVIAAYNPLGWARDEIIRIPVSSPAVIVTDAHGNTVPSQAIPEALVPWETRERYINVQMGGESVKRGEERVGGGEEENQGREVREQQQQQQQQQQLEEQQNQQQNQQQQQQKKKKQQQQKRQQQKQQNKQQNQQQQQQQQQGVVVSVVFRAKVPPLGYSTFFLSPASPNTPGAAVQSTEWQAQVQPGGGGGEWGKGEEAGEGKEEGGRGEEGKEGKEGGEEGEGLEREGVMVDEEGEGVGGGDVIVLGGWDGAASGPGGGAAEVDGAVAGSVGDVATAGAAGVASDGEGGTAPGSTAPGSSNAQSGSSQTALRVLFSKGAYGLARLQLLARNQQGGETVVRYGAVLHHVLCCTMCCAAPCAVLHHVLCCIMCCAAPCAVLHHVLCSIMCCAASCAVLHHVLCCIMCCAADQTADALHLATPSHHCPTIPHGMVPIRVLRGPLVEEFHRALAPWLSEVIRVYPGQDYAEMHYMVGPVPRKPYVGREVVTRFASSLATAGVLFTDSQGRDYLRRVRNHRADWNLTVYQPIAGNFYPLTAGAFIADSTAQLSLLVDRPLGAASLADGQIEVMLHRRMISDDGEGVAEVLDEKVCDSHDNCTPLAVVGFIRFALHPSAPSDTDCYGGDPGDAGDSDSGAAAGASSINALNNEDSAVTGSEEWVSEDSVAVSDSASVVDSGEVADAASNGEVNSEDREWASGNRGGAAGAAADSEESQPPSGRRKLGSKDKRHERLGGKGKRRRGREEKERGEAAGGGVGESGGKGGVRGEAARWRKEHTERMVSPLQLAFAREETKALKAAQGMRWTYSLSHMPQEDGQEVKQGRNQGNTPSPYHLPPNVAIVSLQELAPNEVTVRFAHLYEAKEHPQLSSLASVHLPSLFASRKCPLHPLVGAPPHPLVSAPCTPL